MENNLSTDDRLHDRHFPRLDTDLLQENNLEPNELLKMNLSEADEETTIDRFTDFAMRKFRKRQDIPSPYYPVRRQRYTPKENQLEKVLLHCIDQNNPQHYTGGLPDDEYWDMIASHRQVKHIPDGSNTPLSREEHCALIREGLRQQPIVIYKDFIYIKRPIY